MGSASFKPLSFYINKAREIHGNKYDYSLITEENFINTYTKLPIICRLHGIFYQNFNKHNSRRGCPKCGTIGFTLKNKKPLSFYINKAREVHGNKYDYSLITEENWTGPLEKYKIICKLHGIFEQSLRNHCNKKGCKSCSRKSGKPITFEEFVNKAREVHGNKYDYSLIDQNNFKLTQKVTIVCPEHGSFMQTPSSHLAGRRCSKCRKRTFISADDVLNRINAKHFKNIKFLNLSDYKADISLLKFRVEAICDVHGKFSITLRNLLDSECGCPQCANEKIANSNRMTFDEFLILAAKAHGNYFTYPESSRSSFNGSHHKVLIVCPKHGPFLQVAKSHVKGVGCWKCQRSHMEEKFELKLKSLKLRYETQKTFPDLRGKSNMPLYFDFFLPDRNELIELDGPQHYQAGDLGKFITSDDDFRDAKLRDQKKEIYASSKKFKFIRVRFDEFDSWLESFV